MIAAVGWIICQHNSLIVAFAVLRDMANSCVTVSCERLAADERAA